MAWGISSFTVQEAMYDAVLEFDGQVAYTPFDGHYKRMVK